MFLTDPTCSTIHVQRYCYQVGNEQNGESEPNFDMVIRSPTGVTFGLLADVVASSCKTGVTQDVVNPDGSSQIGLPIMFVAMVKDLCKPKMGDSDSDDSSDDE